MKTRGVRVVFGVLGAALLLLAFRTCRPTPIDRTVLWRDSIVAAGTEEFSMVAVRETGQVVQSFSWHRMKWENEDSVERVDVWLGRWRISDPERPVRADRVFTLDVQPKTQRLFRVIGGSGPDAVLLREHTYLDDRVTMSVWQRQKSGSFEKTGTRTVDDFLGASQGNTAFVARSGGRIVVVDTRTLENHSAGSEPLESLLTDVTGWPRVRLSDDGRYVFLLRDSWKPAPFEGVDLTKNVPISWTCSARSEAARLLHVMTEGEDLRLLIAHGGGEGPLEIMDVEGRTLRTLALKTLPYESAWDVQGGRFFVPVNLYQLPPSLDVLSEDGPSRRIVPLPPAGLPGSRSP